MIKVSKRMREIKEVLIKKNSFFITELENLHTLETVFQYVENNKTNFTEKSWNCNIQTSKNISKNILYDIDEFKYVTNELEKNIKNFLYKEFQRNIPFAIFESWINILGENGYQEPHIHGECVSGVLYLTKDNSEIEFIVYPDDIRKKFIPKKGNILLFDGKTFHRVVESKKERISLAFNLKVYL